MSATEYCSNEHNPTAWNVKRRAKENCLLSWPLAPKRHNSLETGSYCSGGGEKASKTGPFDRCRNQANVLGTVLEQFHLKLLYRRTKCGAQRRPTRRAARRTVPVAQRAYRHREQRGVDSGENHVFRQNADFEICKISKLICSSYLAAAMSSSAALTRPGPILAVQSARTFWVASWNLAICSGLNRVTTMPCCSMKA